MAPIVWGDVVSIAAQLSTVGTAFQDDILLYVNTQLNVEGWGGEDSINLRLGRMYLAAHMATITSVIGGGGGGTVRGQVTSETVGGISRTFSDTLSTTLGSGALSLTSYGLLYDELLMGSAGLRGPISS